MNSDSDGSSWLVTTGLSNELVCIVCIHVRFLHGLLPTHVLTGLCLSKSAAVINKY